MSNGRVQDAVSMSLWEWGAVALAAVLTILLIVPFAPALPVTGVDGSWAYAMNVAVEHHLRFGQDIVFTFGPLAAIYTGLYHPATDLMMLLGTSLVALALLAGLIAVTAPGRRHLLLLLPLAMGLSWSADWTGWRDVVLLFLPLLPPYVIAHGNDRGRQHWVALALLAMAVGILPLVKGNLGVMSAFSLACVVVLCRRRHWRSAFMVVAVAAGAMLAAWKMAGQSLTDLPRYFHAQLTVISGYTDAMSVPGRGMDIGVFVVVAALLVGLAALSGRRRHWYVPFAIALYLFVTFKSGFVRHDPQHALIAAAALALSGMLILLGPGSEHGRGGVAMVLGIVGWVAIAWAYMPLSPGAQAARFAQMFQLPAQGLVQRIREPHTLPAAFERRVSDIAAQLPLDGYKGTVDLYPWDLSPLLASGAAWTPRPVVQSYAAYMPALAMLNAAHLRSNPPQRVFFTTNPVDGRYPALEDGVSWLTLLSGFTPKAIDGDYAVLERKEPLSPALQPTQPVERLARIGQDVVVPGWDAPVWVAMDIRPTLAGKLLSTIFKAPALTLRVRYEDGETADYRLIAGMAGAGFLLSPTVSDAKGFVALGSRHREALLGKRRVVSMGVLGGSGTRVLWNLDYRIAFSALAIAHDGAADAVLAGPAEALEYPTSLREGGHCSIDEVGHLPVTDAPVELKDDLLAIRGWGAIDGPSGVANQRLALLITSSRSGPFLLPVHRVARPDVAAYFHQPSLGRAGFEALLERPRIPVDAQVQVVQNDGNGWLLCPSAKVRLHRPAHTEGAGVATGP
jgi:hypothetical protein